MEVAVAVVQPENRKRIDFFTIFQKKKKKKISNRENIFLNFQAQ